MQHYSQSPTDPEFVQNPYAFYERVRRDTSMFYWDEYDVPCVLSYAGVWAILRDRRFGREAPAGLGPEKPAHQTGFWNIEDHSLLELEPPRHTRLRSLILRAFTSRKIAALGPEIAALSNTLLDNIDRSGFDLIETFAQKLPVIIIARMLGVPEERADQLLDWSHAMVGMYQAERSHADECAASDAAYAFAEFMREHVEYRRNKPADDLITHLIAAEEGGEKLSTEELISTCILLLNAGHEATVHTIGNGVKAMLENGVGTAETAPDKIDNLVEECLRYDAPLHMFQRWAYEDIEFNGQVIKSGSKIACLLAAANRDPERWDQADQFIPDRAINTNASFGAGTHFCIGAPLARLEIRTALPILFKRLPNLKLAEQPEYASSYHFHGLKALRLTA